MELVPLVPLYIEPLRPYEAGRTIESVRRQYGLERIAKLASNENPLGASVEDRPTLFYEVIERQGSRSFGKGKAPLTLCAPECVRRRFPSNRESSSSRIPGGVRRAQCGRENRVRGGAAG